jgi:hypothetical protein
MFRTSPRSRRFQAGAAIAALAVAASLAAAGVGVGAGAAPQPPPSAPLAGKLSSAPLVHHYLTHPEQAPAASREAFAALRDLSSRGEPAGAERRAMPRAKTSVSGPMRDQVFNKDTTGFPQNEESVTSCTSRPNVVLEGTNDYRGALDPQLNSTGWYFSNDGGRTVRREGLLPAIDFGGGTMVPSGGDPVEGADASCHLYAADLNYDPETEYPNGIGLYATTPATLNACSGGTDTACWPRRTLVVKAEDPHRFIDKPWMYVGRSGAQTYVWIVYSEFTCPVVGCASGDYTSNALKAVRCTTALVCGTPQVLSGDQPSIQFGDVTIGPDGSTYVTWEQDNDLDTGFAPPEHMTFWIRVAPPGSTTFGPAHRVADERLNAGLAPLHANDFRISTYPKNDVKMVGGHPRVFVVWEGCRSRPLDGSICEEPAVKLRYSDDQGSSWTPTKVLSAGGDNYFPTISANRGGSHLAVAWFTSRFDRVFHNRQDVELASVAVNGTVTSRHRVTRLSNEPEADPLLGGAFIGDYIEVHAQRDRALVGYNANYRSEQVLGEGFAVPQQDNYLARTHM